MIPAFLEATLRLLAVGAPDDDKDGERDLEEVALLYAKSLTRQFAGLVPAAGPMALSLMESDGARVMTSPAASMLQGAWRGAVAVAEAATGGDTSAFEARALGQFLTVVTGFPLVPLSRAAGYEIDVQRGKARPTGTPDYLRGLIVGR